MHATRPGRSRTRRRTRSKRAVKSPYYEAGTRGLRSLVASLSETAASETAAVLGKLRTNIIGLDLQLLDIWAKG
jgi:hypothetical protein